MCEIKSLSDKKRKRSTEILAPIAAILLLVLSIYIKSVYGIICGVLLLAATSLKKKTTVDEQGILITYDAVVYKYKERWKFTEIKELHKENLNSGNQMALHFMKDVMSKRIIFTSADAGKVIDMAKTANPGIHMDEAYYSR